MIVVNSSVPVSQITETQLRDIFTGVRTRFDNGTRAVPVMLKGGPVHEVFLHRHVGDTPDEFRVRWRKAVFTGQGSMPKECRSEAELLNYVEATPGAIGYVSRLSGSSTVKLMTVTAR
jgi:ABC-type phosphate transport system substrate-binding protein